MTKIDAALKKLIAADASRGIATTVVALDTLTPSKAAVNKPKTFKAAIDQAFLGYNRPDYVLILGGPDVVPHQPLRNPLFDPQGEDWDRTVPSDLPYACGRTRPARDAEQFVAPGARRRPHPRPARAARIPSGWWHCWGGSAAGVGAPLTKKSYGSFFGLTAAEWKKSTTLSSPRPCSARPKAKPRLSPKEGPQWKTGDLSAGGRALHQLPRRALRRAVLWPERQELPGRSPGVRAAAGGFVKPGTVVAAECCYGAEV